MRPARRLLTFVLVGMLPAAQSVAQGKPQSRTPTKEQQAAKAEETARAKALATARTAALVVRATTTVACPGGAPGDCIRTDTDIISQVQALFDGTDVWAYFEKANSTEADIFLEFEVRNSSSVSFSVRDADTNKVLYSEYRTVVSLDNDINRLLGHFLLSAPRRSDAEQEKFRKKRQCVASAARFSGLEAYYQGRLKDFTWKNTHRDDAIMNECEEHWKDFVCLKRGQGEYASNWAESRTEFERKLKLEVEELGDLEQQIRALQTAAEGRWVHAPVIKIVKAGEGAGSALVLLSAGTVTT